MQQLASDHQGSNASAFSTLALCQSAKRCHGLSHALGRSFSARRSDSPVDLYSHLIVVAAVGWCEASRGVWRETLDRDLPVGVSEVAASPTSMTGEEDAEDIEDEDEEKTREQEEEVEEKYKDENNFFRPKSESPARHELDS
ncbi:hypothetical protein E2C01_040777 [Portunus trituberculatus]|uniref:Uncharacterized protein n=1 Tax=Portunus trituberculatus TaxID=210409 RepID=A0A5B7FPP1_PORTR|nr:hypothetical protein [Portunus trituberculatus]